nr:chitobiase/beta-hexosaminidase C-terminal domain-containing protein [uncultured Sphaerochaeta sp.]
MRRTSYLRAALLLVSLLCVLVVLVSCNEAPLTGDLVIDFGSKGSRAITPENLRVTWVQISGSLDSDPTVVIGPQNFQLGEAIVINGLKIGTWTINVVGYGVDPATTGAVALTPAATQSVQIRSGLVTSATFALHYQTGGKGRAEVTVLWTGTHFVKLQARLSNGYEHSGSNFGNEVGVLIFDDIAVGDYGIDIIMRNQSGTYLTDPILMADTINVYNGQISKGTIDLRSVPFPALDRPIVTASAEATHEDPLQSYRTITIESPVEEVRIYYTLDGTVPGFSALMTPNSSTFLYTDPFEITEIGDTEIKAIACKDGYRDSYATYDCIYTITGEGPGGVIITEPALVSNVAINQADATLANFLVTYEESGDPTITATWYLDGNATAAVDTDGDGNQFTFTPELTTTGSHQVTVSLAYLDGTTPKTVSAMKLFTANQVVTPVLTTTDVVGGKQVTISNGTSGATIHCTIDGSIPSTSISPLTVPMQFLESATTTVKAMAAKKGMVSSAIAETTVTVAQGPTPTFSAVGGSYVDAVGILISSTASGATFTYTTDGSTPTISSNEYSTYIPITDSTSPTVLKAMATYLGMANSEVMSATYTITSSHPVGSTGPAGGVIFHVNADPSITSWKYLEAASADEIGTHPFVGSLTSYEIGEGARGTAVGTGKTNTRTIVDVMTAQSGYVATGAADICDSKSVIYESTTYDDWFLPSRDELLLLYQMRDSIGGFVTEGDTAPLGYISSTEESNSFATGVVFSTGAAVTRAKDNLCYVRAIRSFL